MDVSALFLEPHQDDAVLFACWTLLRHRPHVVTVLRSVNQEANGITAAEREAENEEAMAMLGCDWRQWNHPDNDPNWGVIRRMLEIEDAGGRPTRVFAPWPDEPGAHAQHRRIGELAEAVFGSERVSFYTTYAVGGDKTRRREVPYEREWIPLKLRALACYESQILRGPHRFWMMDIREYEP